MDAKPSPRAILGLDGRPVAGECQLDGLAGQRLAFAGVQQPGSAVDEVAATARPSGVIARPAPGEPPAPVPRPCSPCFIWSRSGIGNSFYRNPHPLTGTDAQKNTMTNGNYMIIYCREDRGQSPLDPLSTQHVLLKELLAPGCGSIA